MIKYILIMAIISISIGCKSDPKFDATDKATAEATMKKMSEGLSKEKAEKLLSAVMVVGMSGVNMADILSGNSAPVEKDMYKKLNGKTADEIIAEAAALINKRDIAEKVAVENRKVEEKKQALSEIDDLNKKKKLSEKAKLKAKNIKILKSRYFIQKHDYGLGGPRINIKVKNETKESISRLYLKATLATPGRKIAWFNEDFNYEISGGIEPGEADEKTLTINTYSGKWTSTVPKGAIFTVEVVGADDHNKKEILGRNIFSERDKERLTELMKKFGRSTASGE